MSAFSATRNYMRTTYHVLKPAFFAICTTIVINDKFVELMSVNGDSMAPTLSPSFHETGNRDYVFMNKWAPTKDLKRGDVVSFYTPHKPETLGIKRVVALEGDWIELDWRRRDRNSKDGEQGLVWDAVGESREHSVGRRRVKVPYGHVWVEGDNANKSRDSNWYGPISKSLISGKAMCVVYPFDRFGLKPWEGYKVRTKVKKAQNFKPIGWEDLF